MLYDKDIALDFEMPKLLKKYIKQLDIIVYAYDDFSEMPEEAQFDYAELVDRIDVISKSYLDCGITHTQRNMILNRYGI